MFRVVDKKKCTSFRPLFAWCTFTLSTQFQNVHFYFTRIIGAHFQWMCVSDRIVSTIIPTSNIIRIDATNCPNSSDTALQIILQSAVDPSLYEEFPERSPP